ncbi:MAG: universal stress protein, partial [Candidatus Neomarinimicrobiota bacterium]|nr:universal stress protein [Candidatus Neomarinimicrobiota bacterium]
LNLILRNGDIIEELRDEVHTYNYDVTIIGGSGKRSMGHDLIQYIDSSIFIVNNFNVKQDYRILLAVDNSPGTAKAVKYGIRVAQAFGIDVDLVTISKDEYFGEGYKNASARAEKLMRRSGVAAETLFKVGEPVNTIVEIAGNNHIIIMGASSQSPIAKFFMGSKPLNVIEACNCPVLIVK